MRILWAPWRSSYVENVDNLEGCFLCNAAAQPPERWRDVLLLHKGRRSFIILNKYPYNPGHLMIVPVEHSSDYENLDEETVLEMSAMLKLSLKVLRKVFRPHGFNVGYNFGRPAGAGLETHLHMHVVPRWNGDTNFMPVLAQTKVISQDLLSTYDRLREALGELVKDESA